MNTIIILYKRNHELRVKGFCSAIIDMPAATAEFDGLINYSNGIGYTLYSERSLAL